MAKQLTLTIFYPLAFLLILTACTRSASTPSPEEVIVVQTVEVTRVLQAPTLTPLSPSEEPPPTGEPVSIFGDVSLNYYAYGWLVWAYENGYIEHCETISEPTVAPEPTAEASPTPEESEAGTEAEAGQEQVAVPVKICPENNLLDGDLYLSAIRYIHQDPDYEPPRYSNTNFEDRGIAGTPYAAAAEELGRLYAMPKYFYCSWPSTDYVCPFRKATRAHGAIMIETLAHLDELVYDPNRKYNGSWLTWDPLPRELPYPDCAYAYGLNDDEVHACVAIGADEIYQRRSASKDFGPSEPLTVAVWAEWLYHAFQLFGPPQPVPTPSPTSSP